MAHFQFNGTAPTLFQVAEENRRHAEAAAVTVSVTVTYPSVHDYQTKDT